jgi:hypothetical protein
MGIKYPRNSCSLLPVARRSFFFTFIGSWTMLGSNMLNAYYLDWNKNKKPLRQM